MLPFLMIRQPNHILHILAPAISSSGEFLATSLRFPHPGACSAASSTTRLSLSPFLHPAPPRQDQISSIPFRIRTSENRACNPCRIRTSKTKDLKPFRMNTYKKTGRGAPATHHTRGTTVSGCPLLRATYLRGRKPPVEVKIRAPSPTTFNFRLSTIPRAAMALGVLLAAGLDYNVRDFCRRTYACR